MYKLIRIDDSTSANERDLNQAVADGYILRHIVQGTPGQWDRSGEFIPGSDSPSFFVLDKPLDPVASIFGAIARLDSDQFDELIDNMPDYVVDPICMLCDSPIEESELDDDERKILNRHEFPFVRKGERPAFEVIGHIAADEESDTRPMPVADANTQ